MVCNVYNPNWQRFRRVATTLLLIIIALLISIMTRAFGGGESLYSQWEMPIYAYILTIVVVIILLTFLLSLVANADGNKRAVIKKEELQILPPMGKPRIILGPIKIIRTRFDLWADNDSENWVVEIGNQTGKKSLVLVPKNKFKELEILLSSD